MADINIHVHSENELLDSYSADRTELNPGFVSFLRKQYEEKRGRGETTINIISDAPVDEYRVKEALKHYLETELVRNRNARKHNRLMEAYLFLLGVACIVAGILLTKAGTIYLQILSLTAGFAIKEAATIFFMLNPKNTVERAILLFLGRSKVKFQVRGAAGPTAAISGSRAADAQYAELVMKVGELGKAVIREEGASVNALPDAGAAEDCLASLLALCDAMNIDPSTAMKRALSKGEDN